MALSLPIVIPSPAASTSTDDSAPPRTPMSPNMNTSSAPAPASSANDAALKRKPSRRANTAERRATHNAVERQRRETLNGRFLDLAALLPNLQQIRRPSKSSIVNSSIAHIHASRRHRVLASRELRLLKLESDALRRELNEWRDRAGIPRVEEPARGEGFSVVLGGELEVLVVSGVGEEGEDGEEFFNGPMEVNAPYEMDDEDNVSRQQAAQAEAQQAQALHMARLQSQAQAQAQSQSQQPRRPTISLPSGPVLSAPPTSHPMSGHPMLGGGGPMIASPTQMQFEGHNPVLGTHSMGHHGGHHHQEMFGAQSIDPEKLSAYMYQQQHQQHLAAQQQQQQQQYMIQQQQQQMYNGGVVVKRERSSSIGSHDSRRSSSSDGSGSHSHLGGSPTHFGDGSLGGSPAQQHYTPHGDMMGFDTQWMMGHGHGGVTHKNGMVVNV